MAGFWHLSHHQMRDANGAVYAGAKAYFYEAASLAPITVYQDYGLGTEHSNPVEANAYGVFPPVFFDEEDEFYRQRITSSGGVIIPGTDVGTIPIIGPSGGGGGSEVPVDANALFKTGYPLWLPVSGTLAGFVRSNARTIGSGTSGATERANADCEALYLYLHGTYSNTFCPVTGGRGVSAAADWAANKPIATLDMRNKGAFGLDDMGNSAASGFSGITFALGNATTGGAQGGAAQKTLATTEIPSHVHAQTAQNPTLKVETDGINQGGGSSKTVVVGVTAAGSGSTVTTTSDATPGDTAAAGGGQAFDKMPPFILGTWYVKL